MFYKVKSKLSIMLTEAKCSLLYLFIWAALCPFLVLLFFAFIKPTMLRSGGTLCKADYLQPMSTGSLADLLLILLAVVLVGFIAERNTTANYIVRVQKRSSLVIKQLIKILIFSAVFSLYLIAISISVSGLFAAKDINWNEYTSSFFFGHGYTLDISFTKVAGILFLKTFFSYLLFSVAAFALNIILHRVLSFIIVLVLYVTKPFWTYTLNALFDFAEEEIHYISTSEIITNFAIFPLFTVLIAILSFKLIERKDLLEE